MLFGNKPETPKLNLNISILTAFKVTSVVLLMLLSVQFLGNILSIIMLFLLAVFLAVAMNPVIVRIGQLTRIRRRILSTTIAFGLIVSVTGLLLAVSIFPVVSQVAEFSGSFSERVGDFKQEDNIVAQTVGKYDLDQYVVGVTDKIAEELTDINNVFDILQRFGSAVGAIIIILVMSFMLLLEGPAFMKQFKTLLVKEQAERWQHLSKEMGSVISGYISGQVVIAVIGGLAALIFMTILGIKNALALAGVVTLCALIPLIGAILGAVIVVGLTLLTDINAALILAAYFIIYQQIENATIQPWIQGQRTNLSVLQVFLAALIGAQVAGIAGALLAVPVAACLKIVIIDYLKTNKDYLEKVYLQFSTRRQPSVDNDAAEDA